MIEERDTLDLSHPDAQARTHEELRANLLQTKRNGRWRRVLRNPYRSVRQRLGMQVQSHWQEEFIGFPRWPKEVRERLKNLPQDFITIASIQPDIACHLYEAVRDGNCRGIMECGSGVSSVVIALAIGERDIRFVSLEESEFWIDRTRNALRALGLEKRVELKHAPLAEIPFDGRTVRAHSESGLSEFKADLLLVDAPPADVGRIGVLPKMANYLRPGAAVLLDDAARLGEEECVEAWTRCGLAKLEGYLALGTGLAILRKQ